jgi:hypothetical protein
MSTQIDYYSYDEYIEKALYGAPSKHAAPDELTGDRRSSRTGSKSFTQTESWDECVRLVHNGWPAGAKQVAKVLADIKTVEDEVEKPQIRFDVEGDMVDIGRFVSGDPECMMRWEPDKQQKRIARILFPLSVSGAVSTEIMRWRGACVLALIDRLEAEGVRAQVDVCYASKGYGGTGAKNWIQIANVKRPDEILYMDRMAFHLVHPSSFRRVMFALGENGPDDLVATHGMYDSHGYGTPIQNVASHIPEEMAYDLIIPGVHLYTVEQAVEETERMFQTICPDIDRTSEEYWDTDKM